MLDYIANIDPVKVQAWLAVLGVLLGLVKWYNDNRQRDKWELLKEAAPRLVAAVDRIAQETPTKKDDKFVELAKQALKVAGYELAPSDVEAVKALGSGEKELSKRVDP